MRTKTTIRSWFGGSAQVKAPELGPRERAVLEQLWQAGPLSAAEVMASMGEHSVTLSTVQSTLERLHRKRVVTREKQGRSFLYAPLVSRSELIGRLLYDMAADLGRGDSSLVISGFADFVAKEDPELSARLNEWLDEDGRDD